jgi:hypothetical protein
MKVISIMMFMLFAFLSSACGDGDSGGDADTVTDGLEDPAGDGDAGDDGPVDPALEDGAGDPGQDAVDLAVEDGAPECIGEGESGPVIPDGPGCCEGLIRISCGEPGPEGICGMVDGAFCCTYCGDGDCGTGENVCNCPEDC